MNNKIRAAIKVINSLSHEDKEELMEKFNRLSNTYWFLNDCLKESEIKENLVDEYYDENAEDYLHNVLVYGLDLSYEKANAIMNKGRQEHLSDKER